MRASRIDAWTKASTQMHAENDGCTQMASEKWQRLFTTARSFARVGEYHALHPCPRTEVQEQTNLHVSRTEVIEELLAICVHKSSSRLDLDDNSSLDEQVSAKVADLKAVVPDVDWDLDVDCQADLAELVREGTPVDGFEKAKSKLVVHPKKRANDRARDFAFRVGICVHRGSYLRSSALTLFAPARESVPTYCADRNRTNAPDIKRTH